MGLGVQAYLALILAELLSNDLLHLREHLRRGLCSTHSSVRISYSTRGCVRCKAELIMLHARFSIGLWHSAHRCPSNQALASAGDYGPAGNKRSASAEAGLQQHNGK